MEKERLENQEIDLVYLWCDAGDELWAKKKACTMQKLQKSFDKDASDDCRFIQSDELKYSLRSVEKYAPWINKIFIVTDNQKPAWLDINNPKIKIVDHKEILPADALPCFNSTAIETGLPYIKDLSECFLFANDDTFFWDYVDKSDFFTGDLKPVCRLRQRIKNKKYKHLYGYIVKKAYDMIKHRYGINMPYFPHHNIDAYRKSYFLDCMAEFREEFEKTAHRQFREFDSVQRSIVTYYMAANNLCEVKHVAKPWYNPFFKSDSRYVKCLAKPLAELKTANCKLLCVNDCNRTTNKDRELMKKLLEEKFPEKSGFEI